MIGLTIDDRIFTAAILADGGDFVSRAECPAPAGDYRDWLVAIRDLVAGLDGASPHMGVAVESVKVITEYDGVVHVVAEVFVGVDLAKAGSGEFKKGAAAAVAGGDEDFVPDDDWGCGIGAK